MEHPGPSPSETPRKSRERRSSASLLQRLAMAALSAVSADVKPRDVAPNIATLGMDAGPATDSQRHVRARQSDTDSAEVLFRAPHPEHTGEVIVPRLSDAPSAGEITELESMNEEEMREINETIAAFFQTELASDEALEVYFRDNKFNFRELEHRAHEYLLDTVYANERENSEPVENAVSDEDHARERRFYIAHVGDAVIRELGTRARELLEKDRADAAERAIQLCVYSQNWHLAGEIAYETGNGSYLIRTWRQYAVSGEIYGNTNSSNQSADNKLDLLFRRLEPTWVGVFLQHLSEAERIMVLSSLESLSQDLASAPDESEESHYRTRSWRPGGYFGRIEGESRQEFLARLNQIISIVRSYGS